MSASIHIGKSFQAVALQRLKFVNARAQVPNWQPPVSATLLDVFRAYDPIICSIYNTSWCIDGNLSSFPVSMDGRSESILLSNPLDLSPSDTARYDETFYASTLHGISSLVSILSEGRAPILPSSAGEKFCRHATFDGTAAYPSVAVAPLATTNVSISLAGVNSPGPVCRQHISSVFIDYVSDSGSLVPGTQPAFRGNFRDCVTELAKAQFAFGGGTQFWRYTGNISSVTNTKDELSFLVTASCSFVAPYFSYAPCTYTWVYKFTCLIGKGTSPVIPYKGSTYVGWLSSSPPSVVLLSASCTDPSRSVALPASSNFAMQGDLFFRSNYAAIQPSPGLDYPYNKLSPYQILNSFRSAIDSSWYDIVPSSLFSAVAAVQAIEAGTTTDVLQTLYKLPQYVSMMPKLKEALDILSAFAHEEVSLLTLKEIVDLASATTLQASFQWRPLLQLLVTELPKIVESLSALRSKSSIVVGRGDFKFSFVANTFGRPASTLQTRSKIVLDLSARALASSLLGYDAFGVLPKPSNLWDLLPFTFIVNWFSGVGNSMRRIETAALLSTVPAYYVHTYSISSPFTDSEVANWSMATSATDLLSAKVFYRDVSHFSPLPRDSKFGFGIPTQLPPLGAMGALLWQFLT